MSDQEFAVPADAPRVFRHPSLSREQGERLTRFARYLQTANQRVNLTRIIETDDIYLRHFADALQALPILDAQRESGRLLDVGSGPGVPGLVLACARPAWRITSLEATGKKALFQTDLVADLDLQNAAVIQGRAEELAHVQAHRECYDAVTARALAALPILLELCAPFLKVGGVLLAFKGPDVSEELQQSGQALATLGCTLDKVATYSLVRMAAHIGLAMPEKDVSFSLVILRKKHKTPSRYPRPNGVIRSKPL
jgi:16S rRNA (guanine527-N7)-methyltransferase